MHDVQVDAVITDVDTFEQRILALVNGARAPVPAVPWFLDVDGVINIIGPKPRDGWPRYAKTVSQGVEGLVWPICWAPRLVDLMNLLHQHRLVSFRWLTTWEHDAPARFAPAIGLKVGAWVAAEDRGSSDGWWKLDAVVEHLNDSDDSELFIWTDDDITDFLPARQVVDMLKPGRALVICPNSRLGITPQMFDTILTAIEEMAWA